jgi:hypothetical protein
MAQQQQPHHSEPQLKNEGDDQQGFFAEVFSGK